MIDSKAACRNSYFVDKTSTEAFERSFSLLVAKLQKIYMSRYVSPENAHRFRHGGDWSHPGEPNLPSTGLQTHSAGISTKFDDIVDNNLGLIRHSCQQIVEAMDQQFAEMFYSTVAKTCDKFGNTISTKSEGSLKDAFLKMLEGIEFHADKNGRVTLPEIHAGTNVAENMIAELEAAPPEFQERVEALKARKTDEALAREAARKAKFARYGEDV